MHLLCTRTKKYIGVHIRFLGHLVQCQKSTCNHVYIHTSMTLVLTSQRLGYPDLYFSNGSHFTYFHHVPLLPKWLSPGFSCFGSVMHLFLGYIHQILQLWPIFNNCEILTQFALFKSTWTVCFKIHITMNSLCCLYSCVKFIFQRWQMSSGPRVPIFKDVVLLSEWKQAMSRENNSFNIWCIV